tara:strand:- start:108 stop:560 length:453 start_codon:yes stop_codon:yes gene_type:complete
MEKPDITWNVFGIYVLVLILMLWAGTANGQIQVVQFNASWNSANEAAWVQKLTDCNTISYVDISKQADMAKKHKIAVIPTIIIFKDDNEYNEKSIIGAVAFVIMCLVMILDLVTGWLGRDLAINEFVYDSFVMVVLGCFGIAGLEKFARK